MQKEGGKDKERERDIFKERDREIDRAREREGLMTVILFFKCAWEIQTDNPSLAVKILNGTPRTTLPSREREM